MSLWEKIKRLFRRKDETHPFWNYERGSPRQSINLFIRLPDSQYFIELTGDLGYNGFSFLYEKTLASGSNDKTIRLWDLEFQKETTTLTGHSRSVLSVAFSPDGKALASGSWDNTIRLWDMEYQKEKATLKGHSEPVTSVIFSPEG